MIETVGNLWDYYDKGYWAAITTNGSIKVNGGAVMGAGTAKQAADRFPALPKELRKRIIHWGNVVHRFSEYRLFTFPTKTHWKEDSDLALIERSAQQLMGSIRVSAIRIPNVVLGRPGCGLGKLKWEDVKPVIAPILDDRVTVIDFSSK